MTTTVARLPDLSGIKPALLWKPEQKECVCAFVSRKTKQTDAPSATEMESVVFEARQILGRCLPPDAVEGARTGLVVGYVQSGKTLSFTAVAALARDNGFGLVVLLAGVQTNLKSQSEERLVVDLGLDAVQHDWRHFENPRLAAGDNTEIQRTLWRWKTSKAERRRKTVLITVLKHHGRIDQLAEVAAKLDLNGITALVIDDESDQASPNTEAKKNAKTGASNKSSTYDAILKLKSVLPHHTYLQYTATPQANLLLAIADILSPQFAELVSPGAQYVGGDVFFSPTSPLVVPIPLLEVPSKDNALSTPPETLQSALRLFLIGAAAHYFDQQGGNRSMMVHPSQLTGPHGDYKEWVEGLRHHWLMLLEQPDSEPAKQALVSSFELDYRSLLATFPSLPPFAGLMAEMPEVLSDVRVVKVNSNADAEKQVLWNKRPYWILVGGQKLDRGFTVKGLTVTYMSRPPSANADTLQQRARFFGYKQAYAGLCRVFLTATTIAAFRNYAESEDFIRKALEDYRGEPLSKWKRDFILDRSLSPTRPSVVGRKIVKVPGEDDWVAAGAMYKDETAVESNRILFRSAAEHWRKTYGEENAGDLPEFKDIRKERKNILISGVPLRELLEFLIDVSIRDVQDSVYLSAVELALSRHLKEHPDAKADVFVVSEFEWDIGAGRTITSKGRINDLFIGRQPKNEPDTSKLNYVGDRALYNPDRATVHLRMLKLKAATVPAGGIAEEVPWLAVRLPADIAADCVIEEL
jgi:hypothetical protein